MHNTENTKYNLDAIQIIFLYDAFNHAGSLYSSAHIKNKRNKIFSSKNHKTENVAIALYIFEHCKKIVFLSLNNKFI